MCSIIRCSDLSASTNPASVEQQLIATRLPDLRSLSLPTDPVSAEAMIEGYVRRGSQTQSRLPPTRGRRGTRKLGPGGVAANRRFTGAGRWRRELSREKNRDDKNAAVVVCHTCVFGNIADAQRNVTPEQLQTWLKRFPEANANGDGTLSLKEAQAYRQKMTGKDHNTGKTAAAAAGRCRRTPT